MDHNATVVSSGIVISGTVTGTGPLAIGGRVDGRVLVDGDVSVAAGARCEANIQAEHIDVSGAVKGEIKAASAVTLGAGATVEGSVDAKRVEIDPKATLKGRLVMPITLPRGVKALPTRAPSGW